MNLSSSSCFLALDGCSSTFLPLYNIIAEKERNVYMRFVRISASKGCLCPETSGRWGNCWLRCRDRCQAGVDERLIPGVRLEIATCRFASYRTLPGGPVARPYQGDDLNTTGKNTCLPVGLDCSAGCTNTAICRSKGGAATTMGVPSTSCCTTWSPVASSNQVTV